MSDIDIKKSQILSYRFANQLRDVCRETNYISRHAKASDNSFVDKKYDVFDATNIKSIIYVFLTEDYDLSLDEREEIIKSTIGRVGSILKATTDPLDTPHKKFALKWCQKLNEDVFVDLLKNEYTEYTAWIKACQEDSNDLAARHKSFKP